jgi:hypothetical protein
MPVEELYGQLVVELLEFPAPHVQAFVPQTPLTDLLAEQLTVVPL